jgi:hypothetical protein
MAMWSLLLLLLLAEIPGTSGQLCQNELDESFFNQCRVQEPSGVWVNLATLIQPYTDPRTLTTFSILCVLILPLLVLQRKNNGYDSLNE